MSYHGYAGFDWIITDEYIQDKYPVELGNLMRAIEEADMGLDETAAAKSYDDWMDFPEDSPEKIDVALQELKKAFARDHDGAELMLGYIDSDADSERHGAYWTLTQVYELVPAVKAIGDYINLETWVTYG